MFAEISSVPCSAEVFATYDALLVATAHDAFKDRSLYRGAQLVVDTRNLMASLTTQGETGPRRLVKA